MKSLVDLKSIKNLTENVRVELIDRYCVCLKFYALDLNCGRVNVETGVLVHPTNRWVNKVQPLVCETHKRRRVKGH